MDVNTTRYADTGYGSIAYQVIGKGPVDVVFVPDWLNNVEVMWEEPRIERFFNELASFCRVVIFDKRGTGISDPLPDSKLSALSGVEVAMEDIKTVMDAVGFEQASIISIGAGSWASILFAATSPARVQRLLMVDGLPCTHSVEDSEDVIISKDEAKRFISWMINVFGSGGILKLLDPIAYQDEHFRNWHARYERLCVPPLLVRKFWTSASEINLMSALAAITAPTLVISRAESRAYPTGWGKSLADGIETAEYMELPGRDELYYMAHPNPILTHARAFFSGSKRVTEVDRVLATILFTDLVDSTERVTTLGDRRWRDQLLRHNALVRREIDRFRGNEIDTAGDGFFITFDGPARATRCARAIRKSIQSLGLAIRIGVHAGECELIDTKIGGIAVHTASRIVGAADPGEILVSRTVKDLVAGSGLVFEDRGLHAFKGIPDEWRLFSLLDVDPE